VKRSSEKTRKTAETDISIVLVLDGTGRCSVATGIGFLDHMLTAFGRHGLFDLTVQATGDLEVDAHHLVEDVGLVLGQCIREAVGDKKGINRFGESTVPMDDALVRAVLDLSGRPFLGYRVSCPEPEVGGIRPRLFHEFFQALANTAAMTLHIDQLAGKETHHIVEAAFKAFGRGLMQAVCRHGRPDTVPSTKGTLE